jgi:hypothetical protein
MATVLEPISEYQLELLKSFKFIHEKKQLDEIKSIINFYLEFKLDNAISKKEESENYTTEIYEMWLNSNK